MWFLSHAIDHEEKVSFSLALASLESFFLELFFTYRRLQSVLCTASVNMRSTNNIDNLSLNDRYESDIQYTFQFCHWILKPLGIYYFIYNQANKFEKILSIILILICFFIIQFVIVPFGYYILFYEKDMNTKIKFLGPLTFCLSALFKYSYLGIKSSELGHCIKHVEKDWKMLQNEDHRVIMSRYVIMGRNLITLCAAFMYTGGLSYHTIMPLLSKRKVENFTIRPLTYPGYEAFLNIQKSPTYEIIYCMHCIYVIVVGNITMAAYSLTAIFITHACGQIKIQTLRLENLKNEKKVLETGIESHLAVVVKNHVEILR